MSSPTRSAGSPDCACRRLSDRLWHNTDALDRGVAKRVVQGRYAWLEEGVIDASIPGPWIADTTPGPSAAENVHRSIG
jgi:hypothetical protein